MFQIVLALAMVPIIIKAVQQVRRDPTFTRRRILQNLAGIGFVIVFVGFGAWVLFKVVDMHPGTPTDGEVAIMLACFFAWLAIAFVILLRLPGIRRPR